MPERPGFMIYHDLKEAFSLIPAESAKDLILAMFEFSMNGVEPSFNDLSLRVIWPTIRGSIGRSAEKYNDTILQRKYAGYCSAHRNEEGFIKPSFDSFVASEEQAAVADRKRPLTTVNECQLTKQNETENKANQSKNKANQTDIEIEEEKEIEKELKKETDGEREIKKEGMGENHKGENLTSHEFYEKYKHQFGNPDILSTFARLKAAEMAEIEKERI